MTLCTFHLHLLIELSVPCYVQALEEENTRKASTEKRERIMDAESACAKNLKAMEQEQGRRDAHTHISFLSLHYIRKSRT